MSVTQQVNPATQNQKNLNRLKTQQFVSFRLLFNSIFRSFRTVNADKKLIYTPRQPASKSTRVNGVNRELKIRDATVLRRDRK